MEHQIRLIQGELVVTQLSDDLVAGVMIESTNFWASFYEIFPHEAQSFQRSLIFVHQLKRNIPFNQYLPELQDNIHKNQGQIYLQKYKIKLSMSENYFTGQYNVNPGKSEQNRKAQNQEQTEQQQTQNLAHNKDNKAQDQAQVKQTEQQQKFVDVQQVIIDNQEVEQQIFIENNPDLAQHQKSEGNNYYNQKNYNQALVSYRKALQYTDQKSQHDKKFKSVIYSNIGLTYTKMNQDETSIEYFQKAIKLNQSYTKARTNLAQCYEQTDKLEEALQQYKKVRQASPNDLFIKQKVQVLSVKVHQIQEKRKQEVMDGLKNLGNSVLGFFGMSLDNFKLEKGPGGGYNISMKQ